MAVHALSDQFGRFFTSLNPSPSFEQRASSEHQAITSLIESRSGPARALEPHCFLQGSYRQQTAIYTINDVDIVALCKAWYPPVVGAGAVTWSRDRIFETIAAAILANRRYADKVDFSPTSMVVKVDLGIKVEVLPVVYQGGVNDPSVEPFVLYRPRHQQWEPGYARQHQRQLTSKNSILTGSNFKPMIKVLKHLRTLHGIDAVSFHLECLLYAISNMVFIGSPADYITNVLTAIISTPAATWYQQGLMTPCGDRNIFTAEEWPPASWLRFHAEARNWLLLAAAASRAPQRSAAIGWWQQLLGDHYFPRTVTR